MLNFILYDIESNFSESIALKLFADDLKLNSSLDTNFYHSHMQEAIDSVVAWSVTWQLPINLPKCSSFHIGANNPLYTYYLNSLPVSVSNSPRDLGVDLDPMLRFNNHINAISSKAQSKVGIIFRSFVTKDIRLLKLAYTTLNTTLLYGLLTYINIVCHWKCTALLYSSYLQSKWSSILNSPRYSRSWTFRVEEVRNGLISLL